MRMVPTQTLETTGPVVATSNEPDIVDAARGPRSELGVCWVHDVQDIIGERPTWWWNPLSFVTDLETAEKLADVFISSATSAGAKQDAYFESAGKELLSRLFLAAALARRPITDVFAWANDPDARDGENPAALLKAHGEGAQAIALEKTQKLTEKQRDGVYGTIRPWIGVLGSRKIADWITDPSGRRPHFDPAAFVRSTDTVYLVSKEGGGSARAVTAALTMAILMAAERAGSRGVGGRLAPPVTAVLDEVANVCRWRELPDLYSHYGSRGIVVSAFFPSCSQGVEAFGETGMQKLWSAANVRVVGSGLSEDKFLPFVSNLIGDHDVVKRSASQNETSCTVSTSVARQRLFDVSDLTALPRARGAARLRTAGRAVAPGPPQRPPLHRQGQREPGPLRESSVPRALTCRCVPGRQHERVRRGRDRHGRRARVRAGRNVLPERRRVGARVAAAALQAQPQVLPVGPALVGVHRGRRAPGSAVAVLGVPARRGHDRHERVLPRLPWPEMREITTPDGPFWRLSDVQDRQLPDAWPVEVPPPGLFRDAHHQAEQ